MAEFSPVRNPVIIKAMRYERLLLVEEFMKNLYSDENAVTILPVKDKIFKEEKRNDFKNEKSFSTRSYRCNV